MTGKCYYLTTLAAWQRHAPRFANSHYVVLTRTQPGRPTAATPSAVPDAQDHASSQIRAAVNAVPAATAKNSAAGPVEGASNASAHEQTSAGGASKITATADAVEAAKILVLIEADEGAHLALEDDPEFDALPHPLAQQAVSAAVQSALVAHGVESGATTFDVAEAAARFHPLLRHRVF